jgi:hypothetical protein
MKSKKMEYESEGVMGGHEVARAWRDGSATDGEKFLIFELRFLIGNGGKFGVWKQVARPEAGVPTKTREASPCGKRRYASGAFTALSGCRVGQFTGFYRIVTRYYRLFPHKSTQVVDFPHKRAGFLPQIAGIGDRVSGKVSSSWDRGFFCRIA